MSNPQLNKVGKNWDITASRVYSNSNTNLTLDASGISNLFLKTNGTNRLTINEEGLITFGTLGSYDPSTNTITATRFVGDLSGNTSNLIINNQTASYALVASDNNKRVIMNVSSANTVTVNNLTFIEGDTVFIANKGLGTTTITAGPGVNIGSSADLLIQQYRSALLLAFSPSNFSLFLSASDVAIFDYLVIAGGGGGGNGVSGVNQGGGGGAGGYRTTLAGEPQGGLGVLDLPISIVRSLTYTVTVGLGGASNTTGQNSSIVGGTLSIISNGGGRGKGTSSDADGGSGGGGMNTSTTGGLGISNQGFNGGTYDNGVNRPGGGGGAGALGVNGNISGNGGAGNVSTITGTSVVRGGGGGAANGNGGGQGGSGGGGNGSPNVSSVGSPGTANTGGGGGGGGSVTNNAGGAGGSGIVVIRTSNTVPDATTLTIGVKTEVGSYKIYTFLASGTIAWALL